MKRDIPQARFWVMAHGSPVRICLRNGQFLEWAVGGPTDEGYIATYYTWALDGALITEFREHEEQDCDGLIETSTRKQCSVFKLRRWHDVQGMNFPEWSIEHYRRRDHSAERMGY